MYLLPEDTTVSPSKRDRAVEMGAPSLKEQIRLPGHRVCVWVCVVSYKEIFNIVVQRWRVKEKRLVSIVRAQAAQRVE